MSFRSRFEVFTSISLQFHSDFTSMSHTAPPPKQQHTEIHKGKVMQRTNECRQYLSLSSTFERTAPLCLRGRRDTREPPFRALLRFRGRPSAPSGSQKGPHGNFGRPGVPRQARAPISSATAAPRQAQATILASCGSQAALSYHFQRCCGSRCRLDTAMANTIPVFVL